MCSQVTGKGKQFHLLNEMALPQKRLYERRAASISKIILRPMQAFELTFHGLLCQQQCCQVLT